MHIYLKDTIEMPPAWLLPRDLNEPCGFVVDHLREKYRPVAVKRGEKIVIEESSINSPVKIQ